MDNDEETQAIVDKWNDYFKSGLEPQPTPVDTFPDSPYFAYQSSIIQPSEWVNGINVDSGAVIRDFKEALDKIDLSAAKPPTYHMPPPPPLHPINPDYRSSHSPWEDTREFIYRPILCRLGIHNAKIDSNYVTHICAICRYTWQR